MAMPMTRLCSSWGTMRSVNSKTWLIAIDGFSGAGKSTLVEAIRLGHHEAQVVSMDDFGHRGAPASEWRRMIEQVFVPLRRGHAAVYPKWDWVRDQPSAWLSISPGGLVLVEGVGTLRTELRSFYDACIWVECPRLICTQRLLARDARDDMTSEMATGIQSRWERWHDQVEQYIARDHPDAAADLIVSTASDSRRQTSTAARRPRPRGGASSARANANRSPGLQARRR